MIEASTFPKYARSEIERRWLVAQASLPPLDHAAARLIDDLYVAGGHLRVRVTRQADGTRTYKLGKKYPPGPAIGTPIVSIYLTESEAAVLRALPGRRATKRRHALHGGALDVYLQPQHPFAVFEVEFGSLHEADAFAAPPFAGDEITGNAAYSGYALAMG